MNQMRPSLIEIYDEDHVIPEGGHSVSCRDRSDKECEQIVYESVEGLIHEGSPRQVSHRLELIVDEQLRQHK